MDTNQNDAEKIRTTPGTTLAGKPFDFLVKERAQKFNWKLERIPAAILGTPRDLEIYRAPRKANLIADWVNKAADASYCCEFWADTHIGEGPCAYRCATCFLVLTHRTKCDPSRHLLYSNTGDFVEAARQWLLEPRAKQTLGLGIDCSDSLLYEGVTGYARALIPLFAGKSTNPAGRRLLLLTKSANVHYLDGLPTANVTVSFSLNPQAIADLFEGRYPDGLRITPDIATRLAASPEARRMGFEVRWRIDPIIPVDGWEGIYREFFLTQAKAVPPHRITFGIYREMGAGLRTMARKWGLAPMEWTPSGKLVKDGGTHYQLPRQVRADIYRRMAGIIEETWPGQERPLLALCKECGEAKNEAGITGTHCNCE